MTNKEYAILAAKKLSDKKAIDVTIIDITDKASFADYFVICSGSSERQVNALCDDIDDLMNENELFAKSIEGKNGSGWILMDFGDIIVNVFTNEMRDRYNIEKVWGDCPTIEFE